MPRQKNANFPLLFSLFLLTFFIGGHGLIAQSDDEGQRGSLFNPLIGYGGPDPWLVYYEGNYYLATTTGSTSVLTMRTAPTLADLKAAVPVEIYSETDPSRNWNMWAPEFYLLEGPNGPRWYFYYTAGTAGTLDNQHTHVLESAGTDPLGPYTYKGRLYDPQNDTWAIDGSILQLDGNLYFLFSSWVGPNQSMFIAPMSDPWTISGPRVLLSRPEYDWEKSGLNVNEGPVALYHEDAVFIIYSASFCATPDYKLGMLTYNGGDPLRTESWVKSPEPVFQRSDENSIFGPGHNGFFRSPDGTEDWIIYHANDSETDGCDDGRMTHVQKFTWNDDGTPNFGIPIATTEEIEAPSGDFGIDPLIAFKGVPVSRFVSYSRSQSYLLNVNGSTQLGLVTGAISDSQFYIVPGLADPEAVSIMSTSGAFLRHDGNLLVFRPNDRSDEFIADATWWKRPGLADASLVSFESYNQPGKYIGRQFGILALVAVTKASPLAAREDATFREESDN